MIGISKLPQYQSYLSKFAEHCVKTHLDTNGIRIINDRVDLIHDAREWSLIVCTRETEMASVFIEDPKRWMTYLTEIWLPGNRNDAQGVLIVPFRNNNTNWWNWALFITT